MRFASTDSPPKMKGKYAGFMAELEKLLGRALFRVFCIKHSIKVHWHRFVKLRDGLTQGPKTFNGATCRMLEKEDFWKSDILSSSDFKTRVANFSFDQIPMGSALL